jgi:hypothetical protein
MDDFNKRWDNFAVYLPSIQKGYAKAASRADDKTRTMPKDVTLRSLNFLNPKSKLWHYKYALYSGSNSRAGQVIASWISGSVQYTDFSTIDIGSTLTVTASVAIVTGQAQLNFTVPTSTAGWNIKATATYL